MSPPNLEAAYAPFIASLLAGGFGAPADGGWTAELIAAHVVINNDLIAAAAERIAAGDDVSYDNAASVAEDALASCAAQAGDLAGLAREVERSAARQARAWQALDDRRSTELHVVIRDNGEIVSDGPLAIGAFIEGNASFHIELHHRQLKALALVTEAGPPDEFDSYQLVLLERPANAAPITEEEAATLQRQHLGHFAKMRAAGLMMVAGPIGGDDAIAGICIYRAGSVDGARALAEDDPAVRAGRFAVRIMTWLTAKDALHWPGASESVGSR